MDRIILNQMNDCWSHVMRTVRMVLSVQSITRDLEFVYSPHQRPAGFLTYRSSIQNTFPVSQWMCGLSTLVCIGAVFWNLISKKTASLLTVTSSYRSYTCFPFTCFNQDMEIYSLIKQHRTLLFLTNYNISLYWSQLFRLHGPAHLRRSCPSVLCTFLRWRTYNIPCIFGIDSFFVSCFECFFYKLVLSGMECKNCYSSARF